MNMEIEGQFSSEVNTSTYQIENDLTLLTSDYHNALIKKFGGSPLWNVTSTQNLVTRFLGPDTVDKFLESTTKEDIDHEYFVLGVQYGKKKPEDEEDVQIGITGAVSRFELDIRLGRSINDISRHAVVREGGEEAGIVPRNIEDLKFIERKRFNGKIYDCYSISLGNCRPLSVEEVKSHKDSDSITKTHWKYNISSKQVREKNIPQKICLIVYATREQIVEFYRTVDDDIQQDKKRHPNVCLENINRYLDTDGLISSVWLSCDQALEMRSKFKKH